MFIIAHPERSDLQPRGYSVYSINEKRHVKTWRFGALFGLRALHHVEELVIGFRHRQLVDEEFHCVDFTHRVDNLA